MKTLLLVCTWLFIQPFAAQNTEYNHWSLETAFGANKAMNPYTLGYSSNTLSFPAIEAGGRYMFNSYGGIRMEIGYNQIRFDQFGDANSEKFVSDYWRLSAEAVMNMGQVLDFYTIHPRMGLLTYVGMGLSSLSNDSLKIGAENGSDEMIHLSIGFSPQFRLTDRLAISANFRGISHIYQSRTFDLRSTVTERGMDGFILSGTLGLQFYLGKAATHIDWYDESKGMHLALNERQGIYDSLVEAMNDGDHDGVANYLDEEPQTAEGARVTVKGVTIAPESFASTEISDSETIDGFVEFPEKKELFFSVQVGFYQKSTDLEAVYGLQPLMSATTQSGETRYLYGSYGKLQEALKMRDIAFERGVMDAFVVAYFQGKRITIIQAEKLLIAHGNILLEPVR